LDGKLYSKKLEDSPQVESIDSVTVYGRAIYCHSEQFNGTYKILLSDGTDQVNESFNLTNSYQTFSKTFPNNPFTGANWTKNDVDSLQIGIECSSPPIDIANSLIIDPTGDGTYSEMGGGWNDVSDGSDSTYIWCFNQEHKKESYQAENHTTESRAINSVTVYAKCVESHEFAYGQMRNMIRTNNEDFYSNYQQLQTGNPQWYSNTWTLNPSTSVAWTWDDIDNIEIGIDLDCNGDTYHVSCHEVYMIVNYNVQEIKQIKTTQCYIQIESNNSLQNNRYDISDIGLSPIRLYGQFNGSNVTIFKWGVEMSVSPPVADPGGPYYTDPGYPPVHFDGLDSYDGDENGESIVQYDWKFFDNDSWHIYNKSEALDVTHIYDDVGVYNVTLRVWDDEGENDTKTTKVYVNYDPHSPYPEAVPPDVGSYIGMEDDDPIQFDATGSHDNDDGGCCIVQYDWDFGNGNGWQYNISATPTLIYTEPGRFNISVQVHDDEGITNIDYTYVDIFSYNSPIAKTDGPYCAMEEYGNEPDDIIQFNGSESHDDDEYHINSKGHEIVNWTWDLGDGTIKYGEIASHSYENEMNYSIILSVTDDEGNTSNVTTFAEIEGYKSPISVNGGPYYGINNRPVFFDGTSSYDNDENGFNITKYEWKYFAGDTWHEDGPTPTYIYTNNGIYDIQLRVTDDEDPASTAVSSTKVEITEYQDPVADCGGPYAAQIFYPIQFDASNSHDNDEGGEEIVQYDWKFYSDDNWHYDLGPTPKWTYYALGNYTITVKVTDDEGETDTNTTICIVGGNPLPTADVGGPYSGLEYEDIHFDGSYSHDNDDYGQQIVQYDWKWSNDGVWYNNRGPYPRHSYTEDGLHTVSVRVWDYEGEYSIDSTTVTVENNPPTAFFNIILTEDLDVFQFDASISDNPAEGYHPLNYSWDLDNDGQYDDASGCFITQRFEGSGLKTVKLKIENPDGANTYEDALMSYDIDDIISYRANDEFFLSYPGSSLPNIYNKYRITTPEDMFSKVSFQLGDNSPFIDESPDGIGVDIWEKLVVMSNGQLGDKLIIKGYKNNRWHECVVYNPHLVLVPGWFDTFLKASFPSVEVNHYNDYGTWEMSVYPVSCGYEFDDFGNINGPDDYVDGDYEFDATIKTPDEFTIKSTEFLPVIYNLFEGSFGVSADISDKGNFGVSAGFGFSALAGIELDNNDVKLVGWISLSGDATVSYKIPVFGIPFLAEAGVSGSIGGSFDTGFEIGSFGSDGFSFCPKAPDYVELGAYLDVKAYGEILMGLAGISGGLYVDIDLFIDLPSLKKTLDLEGGGVIEAYALFGAISHEWKFPAIQIHMGPFRNGFNSLFINTNDFLNGTILESRSLDLPCLKNYNTYRGSKDSNVKTLVNNVGELASPKITLTNDNYGVIVWTDITSVNDGNAIQSDLYWAIYDGNSWSQVSSTGTNNSCEYDPEIIFVNTSDGEMVVLTYHKVDMVISETTDIDDFYASDRLHTAVWDPSDGWSFDGENFVVNTGTINIKDLDGDEDGNVFLCYVVDSDCDPFEFGVGKLYVASGTPFDDPAGDYVDWNDPILIDTFNSFDETFQPEIAFVNETHGSIVYHIMNVTSGFYEAVMIPTISGYNGFQSDSKFVLNTSRESINYLSSTVINGDFHIFWIENYSRICHCIITPSDEINDWIIHNITVIYDERSPLSLKPVLFQNHEFLLFQDKKTFTPFILEHLPDDSWGNIRQVSLDDSYALAELDGDSNSIESQMVYIRNFPLLNWLVGRWRFNKGNGTIVTDSSDYGNNGILMNSSWVEHDDDSFGSQYYYFVQFDDAQDRVEVPYNTNMVFDDEFSVTSWIKLNNFTTESRLFGVNGSWMFLEESGMLKIRLWRTNGMINVSDIALLPVDDWAFVGVTYNHGVLRVMVRPNNHSNISQIYDIGDYSILDSGNPLIFGGGMIGCLDDVWLFNADISMSEIEDIWFCPYTQLSSLRDVVVQHLPSFASFNFGVASGRNNVRDDWYHSDWNYRKQIVIDHEKVDGDLTNFPVLISTTSFDFVSHAQVDGDDFIFVLENGIKLNHEIEKYDGTQGKLVVWINITSLSSSVDTRVWIYYGNSTCGSQENAAGTWDSNYAGVWHGRNLSDSTSNGNDLTEYNTVTQDATGKISGCFDFETSNAEKLEDASFYDFTTGNENATIFSWWNVASISVSQSEYAGIFIGKGDTGATGLQLRHRYPIDQKFDLYLNDGSSSIYVKDTSNFATGIWYCMAATYNGTSVEIFRDGVSRASNTGSVDWSGFDSDDLDIGWNSGEGTYYDGKIDELRISTVSRSDDWINTCYNTMNDPGSFMTIGDEQNQFDLDTDNITTEDIIEFTGSPSGFTFEWDFGDGNSDVGESVSHQYDTAGFYMIVCNATDPATSVVTSVTKSIHVVDATPPMFSGLSSAISGDCNVTLGWNNATDTSYPIYYKGYLHNETEVFNFSTACFVTQNTTYTIHNLSAGETYYFVVRAIDAAGNMDNNTNTLSGIPFDNTPPVFNGIKNLYKIDNEPNSLFLEWDTAYDPSEPILYNVYQANQSGGQDYENPVNSSYEKCALISGLNLINEDYYFIVRAEDIWGNGETNTKELFWNTSAEDYSSPEIMNVTASPDLTNENEYVNISCTVTDNIIVENVMINISGPMEFDDIYVSMFRNNNVYYYNISYAIPGTYDYSIIAYDSSGNNNKTLSETFLINNKPFANFGYSPLIPMTGEEIDFFDLSYDLIGYIANWTWDFDDGNISYEQNPTHQYSIAGNYTVYLNVTDNNGAMNTAVKSVNISTGAINVDISLFTGWNLITIPAENDYWASNLAENITGSIMISRFDAINQTYRTYIVGGPPGFDFPIQDGYGYFVLVDQNSTLSMSGYRIDSVSVPLGIGWNMLGWYHSSDTTASSLSENITGSIMVSWFDSISQTFKTYIVGGPPGFDFTISPGMGLFVLVDESSVWHGEG